MGVSTTSDTTASDSKTGDTLTPKASTFRIKGSNRMTKESSTKHVKSASSPSLSCGKTISKDSSTATPTTTTYTSFLADLVATFNTLSSPFTSSTSSPVLHSSFHGTEHMARVDVRQKKKVVAALQRADPAKVNEIIAFLKAMPDPTTALVGNNDLRSTTAPPPKQKKSDKKLEAKKQEEQKQKELAEWEMLDTKWTFGKQKSNDQLTGTITSKTESGVTAPLASLFSAILPSDSSMTTTVSSAPAAPAQVSKVVASSKPSASASTTAASSTAVNTLFSTLKSSKRPSMDRSTGEQIARTAASILAIVAVSTSKSPTTDNTTSSKELTQSRLRKQSSMPSLLRRSSLTLSATTAADNKPKAIVRALLPTTKVSKVSNNDLVTSNAVTNGPSPNILVSTLNTITKHLWVLQYSLPSIYRITVCTYWWGYEIFVPHSCMLHLECVSDTSMIFLGFLAGAVCGIPGMAGIVPLTKMIATWVGFQWSLIKTVNQGKGVIISATWVLPVALAPRSWDYEGKLDESRTEDLGLKKKKSIRNILRLKKD